MNTRRVRQLVFFGALVGLSLFIPSFSLAQITTPGTPASFSLHEKSALVIPTTSLDSIHPQALIAEDLKLGVTNRYGVVQSVSINLKTEGVKTEIPGEGTIWRYELSAPEAYSLKVHFSSYQLPEGAALYLYGPSQNNVVGAFTSINNKEYNTLTLADFKGDHVILEYFEPDSAEFSGEIMIGSVSMAYKSLNEASSTTRIGINCSSGDDWQVEKNSVCLISFIEDRSEYICTGSLLNNVRGDATPYFLSANHCISSNTVAQTLVAYFNYENSTCTSDDASLANTLSGATLKANYSASDFSLMLLSETPPDDYSPYYAGWDASGDNPTSAVGIHHPEGEPKCICTENDEVSDNSVMISWDDRSVSKTHSHWDVYFDEGVTEGGSSGSPLFDQNHHVIGQLHGGSDEESLYGKFSLSWNNSSTSSQQLKAWLDPDNTGTTVLDGLGGNLAPKAVFSTQMTVACVQNSVQLTDKSLYSPTIWLWRISPDTYQFVENTDSTTQNPVVEFLAVDKYTIELIASNKNGSDTLIETNYIDARDQLSVEFENMPSDTSVCGCDISALTLVATGAYTYSFEVSESSYLNMTSSSDTVSLSLDDTASGAGSFDSDVIVTGSHGTCVATDTLLLHVVQEENDNIANAIGLKLGRNATYSNKCGTVEDDEPSPYAGSCYSQTGWCSNETGTDGNLSNSVWFTFVAPSIGHITIDSYGFDDQIAVYKSTSTTDETDFDNLELVAANDNRSSLDATAYLEDVEVDKGKTYWLQVDGRNSASGNLTIDLISNSVVVYPNASDGVFHVLVSSENDGAAKYSVCNINGQVIIDSSSDITFEGNCFDLDLSGYPKGIYLLKVQLGDISSTHKLLLK